MQLRRAVMQPRHCSQWRRPWLAKCGFGGFQVARWFDATEQYPQQLHEVERGAYLQMKAQEVQRQQAAR
ncbi:hypothetical protein [Burkholderia cepacia]|uniref:hypothetical protein n=1 Tax=Burkholderia cepacia TaxID=292 RepID=UPI001F15C96A|nr:hypothetical protein [Burkholderia cepacia]MCE4129133.1 hypothetical protein [Burkholderia cepacia]